MSKAKQVTVQAKIAGTVVFDQTIDGKKHQRELMRQCMVHIDGIGGEAVIRTQTVGARGWRLYRYVAGENAATLDQTATF